RSHVTAHAQATTRAAMPCEPRMKIVPALIIPVATARGTLGAGPVKDHAEDQTAEDIGGQTHSSSQAEVELVPIDRPGKKPDAHAHDDSGDEQCRQRPVAARVILYSRPFYPGDLRGML